jgi:hypothetical protein
MYHFFMKKMPERASTGPQLMARAVIGSSHKGEECEDHRNTLLNGKDYLTLSKTLQNLLQPDATRT